jgi:hypothetical protein
MGNSKIKTLQRLCEHEKGFKQAAEQESNITTFDKIA